MAEQDAASNAGAGEKINKLDSWSVHRICSGQVIVCLAVAVKELVENALDAGAKEIIIRTKEYGSKVIEVQDDGEGILEENFDALCRKHYTSKLQEFSDLENIVTFGFRGEALSSLCALGDLFVTTKHESKNVGHALKFNTEGLLSESRPCARASGTTVSVENIFASLPVRHKQFVGNLKKEFAKMVHILSGYCLIARQVAISLVNTDERGRRHEVLRKRARLTYKDNIIEIFGFKESTKLLPYEQAVITDDVKQEFGLASVSREHFDEVTVKGFVSNCEHGAGRSSADRQFVFVNSRPCDFPKLTRIINSVYHQFNVSQYPFVMLNIETPQHLVDVNLTPDKRMLLLQRENVILAVVKASLSVMFQRQATKYAVSSVVKFASAGRRGSAPLELDGDTTEEGDTSEGYEEVEECRVRDPSGPERISILSPVDEKLNVPPNLREKFAFKSGETDRGGGSNKRTRTSEVATADGTTPRNGSAPLELEGGTSEEDEVVEECRVGLASRPEKIMKLSPIDEKPYVQPNRRERFEFKSGERDRSGGSNKRTRCSEVATADGTTPRNGLDAPTLASFGFTRHLGKKPRLDTDPGRSGSAASTRHDLANQENDEREAVTGLSNITNVSEGGRFRQPRSKPDRFRHLLARDPDEESGDLETTNGSVDVLELAAPDIDEGCDSPKAEPSEPFVRELSGGKENSSFGATTVSAPTSLFSPISAMVMRSHPAGTDDDSNQTTRNAATDVASSQEDADEDADSAANRSENVLFVDEAAARNVGVHFLEWSDEELRRDFAALEGTSESDADADAEADSGDTRNAAAACRFRARISPKENNTAETELMREISKDMFKEMEIVGQFNKGFIVAKLKNDLFIVDQHAADEKFNFETLQATTVIESQPLAVPLKLFLPPGNEQVVLEHLAIFEKNGFRLSFDEDAPCGRQLSLTAVPQSGQWAMGASEIDELVFMLNENYHPNLMNCRPSKVRAMFAMRACRKSVMVGDELKHRDMKRVVAQLSGLQHPWNCPHGRPTMRHLVNLNFVHL